MFGRKSGNGNPSNRSAGNRKRNLSQFGLIDIDDVSNVGDMNEIDDDDDEDLEAELLALTRGNAPKAKSKPKPVVNPNELNKMIQDSLRDIPSDEDVSSGEDDPSIMAELNELQSDNEAEEVSSPAPSASPLSSSSKQLLEERLLMYQAAEQNAKSANDSTKARRMARGVTTLKDLLKRANAGQKINEDDIPPVVSVAPPKPAAADAESPSTPPENLSPSVENVSPVPPPIPPRTYLPSSPVKEENGHQTNTGDAPVPTNSEDNLINVLKERQAQYKKAAISAKVNGDVQTALQYVKIVKSFEPIIQEAEQGAVVDLNSLPPSLSDIASSPVAQTPISPPPLKRQESERQNSTQREPVNDETQRAQDTPQPAITSPQVIAEPKTVLEALQQRLTVFKEREETAKKENEGGKARRNGRIVKQYEDAIKLHKAGKPIPVEELPTPPGYPPIPVNDSKPASAPIHSPKPESVGPKEPVAPREPTPVKVPSTVATKGHSAGYISRNEKQLQEVLQKQKIFKAAALKAKQSGDIDKAKEYLRVVKGIDQMVEASRSGLPIDLSSLPLLPNEKSSLEEPEEESVKLNSCIQGTDLNVYHKLETDLQHQIELCFTTRDHFKAIGDIANANRFDQLALQSKKDLKFVQLANSSDLRVPKFHYETKSFSIVQCNTELTDNDVEVSIVQGVNYNVPNPKEIDTYVKLQFPWPAEIPQQYKSYVVYNTNNPAYNVTTIFNIERNARACQRIFKRQTLKCEVWSKGGFFRSDSLVGTANVKLQPLETQCTVHDAFDLMDGRKPVGGKIEIKIKIRDPILRKQVEHVEEKWLIIDS